jgi:hypothetical protein
MPSRKANVARKALVLSSLADPTHGPCNVPHPTPHPVTLDKSQYQTLCVLIASSISSPLQLPFSDPDVCQLPMKQSKTLSAIAFRCGLNLSATFRARNPWLTKSNYLRMFSYTSRTASYLCNRTAIVGVSAISTTR